MYSISLIVLPVIYGLFAFYAGDHDVGLKELIIGIPFIVAGLLLTLSNTLQAMMVVGALWILHALYDVVHEWFFINSAAPGWYPTFCASVDVIIGVYVIWAAPQFKRKALS